MSGVPYFPQILPANTVVGRLGSNGPTEAIPFHLLFGDFGTAQSFPTRANATATEIAPLIASIVLTGYSTAGDAPPVVYIRADSEPTTYARGKFQSADGQWWRLSEKQFLYAEHFGAFAYTPEELIALDGDLAIDAVAEENDNAFQAAYDFLETYGGGTFYGFAGCYIFGEAGVRYPPGCHFEGQGHGRWMPSFPTWVKTWEGTNLIPKADGLKNYTAHGITSGEFSGGWRTDPDNGARKFKLLSFMNRDASGTTPATPRAMAVFWANKYRGDVTTHGDGGGVRKCRMVPWIGTDGISDYSTTSGSALGAEWDIMLLCDTMELAYFQDVQCRGYPRMYGIAEISPDYITWSRSEANRFVRCSGSGLVGIGIRSGNVSRILATSSSGGPGSTPTAEIKWEAESIWPSSGQLNTANNGYVTYTSTSRNGDNLVFEGLSTDLTGEFYVRNPYRGTGFSTGAWYDCEAWALWHHSGQKAEALGFSQPSCGFECSGFPMRGINFFNCSWNGEQISSPAMHLHNFFDMNLVGGKAENGHVISSALEASQELPATAALTTSNISLLGFQFTGSVDTRLWNARTQRDLQRQWNPTNRLSGNLLFEALTGQHFENRISSGNRWRVVKSDGSYALQIYDSGTIEMLGGVLNLGTAADALLNHAAGFDFRIRENTTLRWQSAHTTGHWTPGANNSQNIGSDSLRIATMYATTLRNGPNQLPVSMGLLDAGANDGWSHTGDTNKTAVRTVELPANSLGINGFLEIETFWETGAANTNTKRVHIDIGSVSVLNINLNGSTNRTFSDIRHVHNAGAANVQYIRPTGAGLGVSATEKGTVAIDTTIANNIVFSIENANSGDLGRLVSYSIKVFHKAT